MAKGQFNLLINKSDREKIVEIQNYYKNKGLINISMCEIIAQAIRVLYSSVIEESEVKV